MEGYVQSYDGVYTLKPRSTSVGRHREPDLCLQVTCQCVCQRSACPGHLHMTEDPKTVPLPAGGSPQLPALTSLSPSIMSSGWILGSSRTFPRPPPRQRATSGSNARASERLSTDTHPQLPVATHGGSHSLFTWKPGSDVELHRIPAPKQSPAAGSHGTGHSCSSVVTALASQAKGLGFNSRATKTLGGWTDPPAGCQAVGDSVPTPPGQSGQYLQQEKEQLIMRMGDEIKRLCEFESESKRKDSTMAQLRNEMESLRQAATHTGTDSSQHNLEISQKLLTLGCDIEAKTTEIEALKEQINNFEKGSNEILIHSLKEKDLEIIQLRNETKNLKRNNNMTSGLTGV